MGNVKQTFNCTEFPEDKLSLDAHTDDDYILVELWSTTDGATEYNNIGLSKKELLEFAERLRGDSK